MPTPTIHVLCCMVRVHNGLKVHQRHDASENRFCRAGKMYDQVSAKRTGDSEKRPSAGNIVVDGPVVGNKRCRFGKGGNLRCIIINASNTAKRRKVSPEPKHWSRSNGCRKRHNQPELAKRRGETNNATFKMAGKSVLNMVNLFTITTINYRSGITLIYGGHRNQQVSS